MEPLDLPDRHRFREWLISNHHKEKECWVYLNRGKDDGTLSYLDCVEEALCFGWIDSTVRSHNGRTAQRFSPRRRGSRWTELNKARCERLERLGLMTPAGREALSNAERFSIDEDILALLRSDPIAWNNLQTFPKLYVRVRIDNIQYLKDRDPDTYRKRLDRFMKHTKRNEMYGDWNDDGKLLMGTTE